MKTIEEEKKEQPKTYLPEILLRNHMKIKNLDSRLNFPKNVLDKYRFKEKTERFKKPNIEDILAKIKAKERKISKVSLDQI